METTTTEPDLQSAHAKSFKFYVKSVDEGQPGTFEGMASVYGNVDSDDEIIDPGCFTRSISQNSVVPILWSHRTDSPVGFGKVSEDARGVRIKGDLMLDCEDGRRARAFLLAAQRNSGKAGLSVGFRTTKGGTKEVNGRLHFTSAQLLEVSICVFQANPGALVSQAKSQFDANGGEFTGPDLASLPDALPNPNLGGDMASVTDIAQMDASAVHEYLKANPDVLGKLSDAVTAIKGATRRVDGKDLGPESFAYVGDPSDPSTFKLPIHDQGHARAALGRFNQTEGIPESEKPAVLAKIRAAAKRFGIQVSDEGKADMADIQVKDFAASLTARQAQRQVVDHLADIAGALNDTLESIHADDSLDKAAKRDAVSKAYADHSAAVAELHCKATGLTGDAETDNIEGILEVLGTKADTDILAWVAKSKMPAAKRATVAHAMGLMKHAKDQHMELYAKASKIMKDAMDGDGDYSDPNIGTDEMMSEDTTDATNKSEEAANEVRALFDGFRGELNKLAS